MSNVLPGHVTESRRKVLFKVVRANQGCVLSEVLEAACALHKEGKWPPPPKGTNGRADPYQTGCRQLLLQLVHQKRLLRYTVTDDMRDHFCTPAHAVHLAPDYLPEGEERERCEALIRRFQHEAGMDMALGVTEHLTCLVRIGTARGVVDWHDWRHATGWEEGIVKAATWVGAPLR